MERFGEVDNGLCPREESVGFWLVFRVAAVQVGWINGCAGCELSDVVHEAGSVLQTSCFSLLLFPQQRIEWGGKTA